MASFQLKNAHFTCLLNSTPNLKMTVYMAICIRLAATVVKESSKASITCKFFTIPNCKLSTNCDFLIYTFPYINFHSTYGPKVNRCFWENLRKISSRLWLSALNFHGRYDFRTVSGESAYIRPVIFNWGSAEPKGFVSIFQGFRGCSVKNKNNLTCEVTSNQAIEELDMKFLAQY